MYILSIVTRKLQCTWDPKLNRHNPIVLLIFSVTLKFLEHQLKIYHELIFLIQFIMNYYTIFGRRIVCFTDRIVEETATKQIISFGTSLKYVPPCGEEGVRGGVVVKALCYKPAGSGFDSRCCNWNFSVTESFWSHYGSGVDSASNRNDY